MLVNHRLLVVDDEPSVSRVITSTAEQLGIEARSINDSSQFREALAFLRPTIIFLDIAMPGRDGVELIGDLAAGNYSSRIVLMSGSDPLYIQMSFEIASTRGLRIGGTLAKPFRKQAVTDLLVSLTLPPDTFRPM